MERKPAGYEALLGRYGLDAIPNWHRSFVATGTTRRIETVSGITEETYPSKYWPGDGLGDHLEFALKYDGANLSILASLFQVIPQDEFLAYAKSRPTGKYARRLWFLYEFLTGSVLPLEDAKHGNYVDLLDSDRYYTTTPVRQIRRQRVNDNLLGQAGFCPTVRRTDTLRDFQEADLTERCKKVVSVYSPGLLKRALSYLYTKETRSSFEIEHITPNSTRTERFIALLRLAETEDFHGGAKSGFVGCPHTNTRTSARGQPRPVFLLELLSTALAQGRSVDWPYHRLERVPPSAFRPRHCPRRGCPQHRVDSPRRFRYARAGFHVRKSDERRLPRFRCSVCKSRFIQSAFTASYYLKRPELLVPVAAGLNAGSAHRQLARSLGCAPSTVTRLSARLGRHALLLQSLALEQLDPIREPVVLDHLETFVVRQEEALGLATPVGQESRFTFGVDPAPHRRGGRRTPAQKRALTRNPVRIQTASVRQSATRVLDLLLSKVPPDGRLSLISDGHPALATAVADHPDRDRITHRVYPNPARGPKGSPRSPRARLRDRQMHVVDALHGLVRHTLAHCRRETIAFGRRANAMVERTMLLIVWRNFVKRVTERQPRAPTAAMNVRLTDEPWSWDRVLARRLFPDRVSTPPGWDRIYRREWITASIGPNTLHRCRFAF